ncbi:MAG: hypothetical protein ACK418_27425, partial [Pseudomonas sp.]|uniref:hypothetical protein n=1 Tax=Pseudomonas sp. TaxID=306 RepID=UPI0039191A95
NQRYADCRHQDCVAQTIDTVGVAGAGLMVASPACGPGAGVCFSAGRITSTGATFVGGLWASYQALNDNMSLADVYVTSTTTAAGLAAKNPWINLAASIAQLLWDSQ